MVACFSTTPMKKLRTTLIVLVCCMLFSQLAMAQFNIRDSAIGLTIISPSYAFQIPGGALAQTFGVNSAVGINLMYKTRNNWIFAISGDYLFGNHVKQLNMLDSIATHDNAASGFLRASNGKLVDRNFSEEGFTTYLKAGKVVPLNFSNRNSGLLLMGGIGFLEHAINIILVDGTDQITPQLNAQMRKGYDHLSNGIAFVEQVGYMHLSNNRLFNFFFDFELNEGYTQDRRYDYQLNRQSNQVNTDLLWGIRVGWMMPLYKRQAKEFYTY